MARRPYGYPRYEEPQQTQVTGVPYISLYDPNEADKYAPILAQAQQRYDISQSAIAKYLSDYAESDIDASYLPDVDRIVQGKLGDIQKVVAKHDGQYGDAANEIVKELSLARRPIAGAIQATKARQEAANLYQKLLLDKNVNRVWNPQTKSFDVQSFEDIVKNEPIFNAEGKFIGAPNYMGKFRGAGNYEPYIERMVDHIMKQSTEQGLSPDAKYPEFLKQVKLSGADPNTIRSYFEKNTAEGQELLGDFLANNPIAAQEFVVDGKFNQELAKDYLSNALSSRVKQSKDYQYMGNPGYKTSEEGSDGMFANVDTFDGIAGVVPSKNLEIAKQEVAGTKGRSALGQSVVETVKRFNALPELLGKWGYGLTATFSPIQASVPSAIAGSLAYGTIAKQKEKVTEENIEKGIEELGKKVDNEAATARERKLYGWLKDDTNTETPLSKAAINYYGLKNPTKDEVRRANKKYIKDFSTKSVNPAIEIDYIDAKGNVDLKNLKGEDEVFFAMNKDGAPTLTGAAVNTFFYDIETGEKLSGTEFIEENENNPVQGFAKYAADNPYSPGAKQIVISTENGPKVYAMVPSREKVAKEALPWMFHQAQYYPEQQINFKFPNIKTGGEDEIEILNKGVGKNNANSEIEVLVNGKNILDLVPAEGSPFKNGRITTYNGISAENIAYKYYLTYLKSLQ